MSEWFLLNVGLSQSSVMMTPRLFNVNMDGVVREVNARLLRKGLDLIAAGKW